MAKLWCFLMFLVCLTLEKRWSVKSLIKTFTPWDGPQGVPKFLKEESYGWVWTQTMDYMDWTKKSTRAPPGHGRELGCGCELWVGLLYYFYRKFIYVFLINTFFLISVLSPNSCVCSAWSLNSCDFSILVLNNCVRSD